MKESDNAMLLPKFDWLLESPGPYPSGSDFIALEGDEHSGF